MQTYTSRTKFSSAQDCEILVTSARCQYDVWLNTETANLRGPGVEEDGDIPSLLRDLSREDQAIVIVLMFENGNWPED